MTKVVVLEKFKKNWEIGSVVSVKDGYARNYLIPNGKAKDNPVYYVQYAYARINSIARTLKKNLKDEIYVDTKSFNFNEYEEKIYRKVFEWPKIIESAAYKFEPHKIPFYLYELSTLFHSYWSKGNEDSKFRFIEKGVLKRFESFVFLYLIAIVIRNGMNILGVSLPEKM